MQATTIFYIIISILIINFIVDRVLDYLNEKCFDNEIPDKLKDIYDEEEYKKSQSYKKTSAKFSNLTSLITTSLTIVFFLFDGFKHLDTLARNYTESPILVALIFFGVIIIGSEIVSTPLSYYETFVIEEKFGFNKSTKKIFWLDKIKGIFISILLGGAILSLIIWFYQLTSKNFWVYAWGLVTAFSLFINMFHAKLIVPLFNKQSPLEDGELKMAIEKYAKKVGFTINNIFVIDGSKRSTKANAYFSGFGSQKRITLYDTLINDLSKEEIVAVLAHEVGHYKKRHIIFNLVSSIIITGIALFILSLMVSSPILSEALGVSIPSFHIGLIAFGILYSPISEVTGLFMNYMSRKFEYQADNYAKETFAANKLITSLKKLSKNSLSNLTPHPAFVFVHYSHPTLLERIKNLES
ncbi:MAG: M48 family metallopeptidase [Polaribacter sp.]|uniref:M48 family metallopeptidase n=1 Tax=Polaribacter sp. TaxID=1920175 RepID=UPI003266EBA1